jgi:hypothetical protein
MRKIAAAFAVLASLLGGPALAQGTIPVALAQQVDANGRPLSGALLYIYVVGTVNTQQNAFQDVGLTNPLPWPVVADQNGRFPMFYLASGSVAVRATDSTGGMLLFFYPTMLVIGPAGGGGGGGGGGTIDPTTISTTGDVKFRMTSESLSGWVKLNAQTIGSGASGATGRANADTQALFIYLWTNCPNTRCPVSTGRGATALADFSANKRIGLPDMRDRSPAGRDCMESTCLNVLLASNITSGGGDTADTPGAFGGAASGAIAQANLPSLSLAVAIPAGQGSHAHSITNASGLTSGPAIQQAGGGSTSATGILVNNATLPAMSGTAATGGSNTPLPLMDPFLLGSWYMRL